MAFRCANQPMQNLPPVVTTDGNLTILLDPYFDGKSTSTSCKSDCSTKRCKCNKNGLICTDMCKCLNCKNNNDENDIIATQDIELDDFDYFI